MQRTVGLCLALAIVLGLAAQAQALPVIVVGTHNLLPNTPGQLIDISVSGGDAIQGVLFSAMINGGGTLYSGDGGLPGPTITGLDLISGTHTFALNHNTPSTSFSDPQLWSQDFLTSSGTVAASGVLATIVVDTSGWLSGDFPLDLIGGAVANNPGDTALLFVEFGQGTNLNGLIHIVPEPSSVVLGLFGVVGLAIVAIRKRRARRA